MPDTSPASTTPRFTAVILTALETEYKAVLDLLVETRITSGPSGREYREGRFHRRADATGDHAPWRVLIHEGGRDQMNALRATDDAARDWQPDAILFVGVAGGRPGKTRHFEVLVGREIAYYETAKVTPNGLRQWYKTAEAEHSPLFRAAKVERDEKDKDGRPVWTARVRRSSMANQIAASGIAEDLQARMAPIASGEKVVTDTHSLLWEEIERSAYRVEAVETEGYGFSFAKCQNLDGREIPRLMVRGISDMMDDKNRSSAAARKSKRPAYLKNLDDDERQKIASAAAAAFAFQVLVRFGDLYLNQVPRGAASNDGKAGDRIQNNYAPSPELVETLITLATRPLEKLNEQQRTEIQQLRDRLGTSDGVLHRVAAILGAHFAEGDIPFDQLSQRLVDMVRQREEMIAQQRAHSADPADPDKEFARIQRELDAALAAGDDQRSRQLLMEKRDAKLAASEKHHETANILHVAARRDRLDAAESEATLGNLALARLEYLVAADHFRVAIDLLPPSASKIRGEYLNQYAGALETHGYEKGDNAALLKAIDIYRKALLEFPRGIIPLNWAAIQNNLGNTLQKLGEREHATARLEEAIEAYHAVLEEYTREHVPLKWATTQNNLGSALQGLSWIQGGTARLEEAIEAYRLALQELTREQAPLMWATTQNNLGTALGTIGEQESDIVRLEEAVKAFRLALQERTRRRVPLYWATTQNNLGRALQSLGEQEDDAAHLKEAVEAYRAALQERTRERVPLQWAKTQDNLGSALWNLGERESSIVHLEEALEVIIGAHEAYKSASIVHFIDYFTEKIVRIKQLIKAIGGY